MVEVNLTRISMSIFRCATNQFWFDFVSLPAVGFSKIYFTVLSIATCLRRGIPSVDRENSVRIHWCEIDAGKMLEILDAGGKH